MNLLHVASTVSMQHNHGRRQVNPGRSSAHVPFARPSGSTMGGMDRVHSDYRAMHGEPLARPFPVITEPAMVSHRAVLCAREHEAGHHEMVARLATGAGAAAPPLPQHGFVLLQVHGVEVRVERHHEFTSVTVIARQHGDVFAERAIDRLPVGWDAELCGPVLAAVEIASEPLPILRAGAPVEMDRVARRFCGNRLVGGWVVDRVASVWSDFQLDAADCGRFLIQDHQLTPGRYGRLIQRLLEIETYRMAALLSLPLARRLLPAIDDLERRHTVLVERLAGPTQTDERAQLMDLTGLAVELERLHADSDSRFGATKAYARILNDRVKELREQQMPGYQTIGEFLDRRLVHAFHTCSAAHGRLRELHTRVTSSTALLRTRVEVNLQSQNQKLLSSVDRRAEVQLRLQHAVEGLSVVILTYYLTGLIKYLLEGLESAGVHLDVHLTLAGLVPIIAGLIWWSVRRVHHKHLR